MRLLVDTHILVWAVTQSPRLSSRATSLVNNPLNEVYFSTISLWEIAVKVGLGRDDFDLDVRRLRSQLLKNDYSELQISIDHLETLTTLPQIHKDPFDRLLIAKAMTEGLTLLTSDHIMASYGGDIVKV